MSLFAPALLFVVLGAPASVRSNELAPAPGHASWSEGRGSSWASPAFEAEAERAAALFGAAGGRCEARRGGEVLASALPPTPPPEGAAAEDDALALYRGPGFVENRVHVRRGDTFASLLDLYDVPLAESLRWHRAARGVFDLSRLRVGHVLSLFFRRDTGELAALEYAIDDLARVAVDRDAHGRLRARRSSVPTWIEHRGVAGAVGTSITQDCRGAEVPAVVVRDLTRVFAGEVAFRRLARGDRFRILYEVHVDEDGRVVRAGRLLAAEIETKGKRHVALLQGIGEGRAARDVYVDANGRVRAARSAERFHAPVRYSRITSRFSRSRWHPLFGRRRPHLGVDFAAPRGTAVHAIADGRVAYAGWRGQLGRAVRLEHGKRRGGFSSIYGHLTRLAKGIRPGARVRAGQVIGFVGSTGAATGPHLHLSIRKGGRYVDPLSVLGKVRVSPPPERRIAGLKYERERRRLLAELASLELGGPVQRVRLASRR